MKSVAVRIFRIAVERWGGIENVFTNPLPIETVPLKNIERKVKTKEEVKITINVPVVFMARYEIFRAQPFQCP